MATQIELMVNGTLRTFSVKFEDDTDMGAPWKNSGGHGDVSDWTTRDKLPGELVLNTDRGQKRYYDFAGACRTALRDGWDAKPYNDGTQTKRQQAAKAAMADFEFLRAFCDNRWSYVGVIVTLLDDEGEETELSNSLWGVDNFDPNYPDEVAKELAAELGEQIPAPVAGDCDDQKFIEAANSKYASDDCEFDDAPKVSPSEKGAFVQCWVWVSNEEAGIDSGEGDE
jgi:hypothetical protein